MVFQGLKFDADLVVFLVLMLTLVMKQEKNFNIIPVVIGLAALGPHNQL